LWSGLPSRSRSAAYAAPTAETDAKATGPDTAAPSYSPPRKTDSVYIHDMKTHKYTVEPKDQEDHLLGLEIARVLGLKPDKKTGYYKTTHGRKNPCGLKRTIDSIISPNT
jgi:hypothetical protein